jgi:Tol biopolymer transport system component
LNLDRQRRVQKIFQDALEIPAHERSRFLDSACADDPSLKPEVAQLIRSFEAAGSFLESSPAGSLVGQVFGSYQVKHLLGSGGMGQVYLASDSKLKRDVAIKVLPDEFSRDPERVSRFQREAEVLASLNHPHIAAIYDLADFGEFRFLVLELIDGDTLYGILGKRGALPTSEALRISKQICEALEAAHEKGIVHRDLKPANVKVMPDGKVKVLDFGLAKTVENQTSKSSLSNSPTATKAGIIVGTAAYMSPEQAKGQAVDRRSDIFSFGCVLYELLAGQPAFYGDSATEIVGRVVTAEPDWSRLPAATPAPIRRLLRRMLKKDSRERLGDIRDARLDIEDALNEPAAEMTPAVPARKQRLAWIIGTLAIVLAALIPATVLVAVRYFRPAPAPEVRFEIPLPELRGQNSIAISPDGRLVSYAGRADDGKSHLWVRSLNSVDPQLLPGTEEPLHPFWSPDGRSIGFSAGSELKAIDISGGPPRTVTRLFLSFFGGTWNRDGGIVFADGSGTLRYVSASGGEPRTIIYEDTPFNESQHYWPLFLPDGRHFLFLAWSGNPENRAIYIGSVDSKNRTRLMAANSMASYAAGFLFFVERSILMARPFDATRLEFTGDAIAVADGIGYNETNGRSGFAASDQGTLIYREAISLKPPELVWVDRTGKRIGPLGAAALSGVDVRLSPDGKRVAFSTSVDGGLADVWIYDIDRDQARRLTTDLGIDHMPVWSPDGSELIFDSNRLNRVLHALFKIPSSGAVAERLLLAPENGFGLGALDWSRDGRMLLFEKAQDLRVTGLWVLPLFGDGKPFPYVSTPFITLDYARISPNGRWVAYASTQSGSTQVIVQPFPDPSGGYWPISSGKGGTRPKWKRDGTELYYMDPEGQIVAVRVETEHSFQFGKPTPLFKTFPNAPYDVTPDGKRFLVLAPAVPVNTARPPITVILNWNSSLKR